LTAESQPPGEFRLEHHVGAGFRDHRAGEPLAVGGDQPVGTRQQRQRPRISTHKNDFDGLRMDEFNRFIREAEAQDFEIVAEEKRFHAPEFYPLKTTAAILNRAAREFTIERRG